MEGLVPETPSTTSGSAQASTGACDVCWDQGWVLGIGNPRPPGDGWGLRAWYDQGVAPEKIPWCDCSKAAELRGHYEEAWKAKQQKLTAINFQVAGIPSRYQGLDLATFKALPQSVLEGKMAGVAAASMYIDVGYVIPAMLTEYGAPPEAARTVRPDRKRFSLFFFGPVGVGKTGLLSSVFRHCVERVPGLWIQYSDFVLEVQGGYSDGTADDKLRAAQRVPLLFLDDLGSESSGRKESDDKRLILWQLISYRHGEDLPTFITSNIGPDGLRQRFETRIVDRIEEMSFTSRIAGQNLRGL